MTPRPIFLLAMLAAVGANLALVWVSRLAPAVPLPAFGLVMAGLTAAWLGGCLAVRRSPPSTFWLLGSALLLRLIAAFATPVYEDDWYRYLWDGYRFAVDGTPYGRAPSAHYLDETVARPFQTILSHINNPDLPTIYGPTLQALFLLAYRIDAAALWPLKLFFVAADLALVGLLLHCVPAHRALLYAWNPLVLKEIACTAHPDGLVGLCLLAGWLLVRRSPTTAAAVLALGVGVKAVVGSAVPLLLGLRHLRPWAVFGMVLAGLYLPFLMQGSSDLGVLLHFAREFRFNASIYEAFSAALGKAAARSTAAALYLAGWIAHARHHLCTDRPGPPRLDRVYGALLLLSPVFNPWYLLWLLPFACLFRTAAPWVASVAVLLAYVTGLNLDDTTLRPYEVAPWARRIEFGTIFCTLAVESWSWARRRHDGA